MNWLPRVEAHVRKVQESDAWLPAVAAVREAVLESEPIVITGIGKSFLVGQRAAATWRSLGANAWAESATDLLHGGLGAQPEHVIAISHSGLTLEVCELLDHLTFAVVITHSKASPLARRSRHPLVYGLVAEPAAACGLPIVACHVQATILDELILAVSRDLELTPDTVARWHPGGAIGERKTT